MDSTELILENAGEPGRRFPLGPSACGIGRSAQNTIVLQSEMVSRNHAMVHRNEGGGYSVFDLGSRNGTFVNGRRLVGPARLRHGDVLTIGSFVLVFSDAASMSNPLAADQTTDSTQTRAHVVLREITVLVVDIRDFTGLAREIGENRIADLMGSFNHGVGAIFDSAGTWAVKYIGDAAMAIWDHRGRERLSCLRAALQTVVAIQELAVRLQSQYDLPRELRIGFGINTGLASVGNLGGSVTSDYTALGDVVNKAFRLESSTRLVDADLAFGDEVRQIISTAAGEGLISSRQLQLKGYGETCNVYTTHLAAVPALLALFENRAP